MNKIYDLLKDSNSILLLTHESPDGDAIGSMMAFYYMLKDKKKEVNFLIQNESDNYSFLKDINTAIKESNKKYDLAIVLDCANESRIGQDHNEFKNCKKHIVIDHHTSNTKYGDINYVDEDSPACCQIIYYLFKEWGIRITTEIGEALTMGVITDTAGFRNDNVNKETFLMMADMIEYDVNINKIYYDVLSKKSNAKYMLMKMTLDRLELYEDGKIAFSYISQEDLENVGAKYGDHEGLVDLGRNIDGVMVSIFMREDDGYKISFRSNGVINVNKIASAFGGGGHKMAAGAKSSLNFKETKEKVINETIKELYR